MLIPDPRPNPFVWNTWDGSGQPSQPPDFPYFRDVNAYAVARAASEPRCCPPSPVLPQLFPAVSWEQGEEALLNPVSSGVSRCSSPRQRVAEAAVSW